MSFKDKIFNQSIAMGVSSRSDGGRGAPGGNGSGSRQDPPNLDDIIKNFQKTINKFSGGKSGGSTSNYYRFDNFSFVVCCKWSL